MVPHERASTETGCLGTSATRTDRVGTVMGIFHGIYLMLQRRKFLRSALRRRQNAEVADATAAAAGAATAAAAATTAAAAAAAAALRRVA